MASSDHFSVSQLSMFQRCPEQYRRRYMEGDIFPPGLALVTGRATHKSAEVNLKQKVASGEMVNLDVALDAAREEVHGMFEDGVDTEGKEKGAARDEATDEAVALSEVHYRDLAPVIQPVEVEHKFEIEVGLGRPLLGFIDVVEDGAIRDLKTAKRSPSQGDVDANQQLTAYHLAMTKAGKEPAEVVIDAVTKTKKPKVVTIVSTRKPKDHDRLIARMGAMEKSIEAGNFVPTDPSSWVCNERFCGYYSTCPYAGGAVKEISVGKVPY